MAIRFAFNRPIKDHSETFGWLVKHPSNGAILAYCDEESEAEDVMSAVETAFASIGAKKCPYCDKMRKLTGDYMPPTCGRSECQEADYRATMGREP